MKKVSATFLTGDAQMGNKDDIQFEDEELNTLDDIDGDENFDDPSEDPVNVNDENASEEERRIKARREIERRNELKALKSELDEWDDLLDDEEL
jgi:hypothetical protein